MKVVEFGYAGAGSEERLCQLMQDEKAVLVDIRLSPCSRWQPQFNRSALASNYRGAYLWLGDELGNLNYKPEDREKGIKLAKPETGIARLITGMRKGFTLIIMCACKEYSTCHRHTVIDLLCEQMPELEVVHPEGSEGELIKCLSIREPYASWIANPDWFTRVGLPAKTIENRDWSTRYRGPVLLHASATFEDSAMQWCRRLPGLDQAVSMTKSSYAKSAIVGIADLVDCVDESDDPWFLGEYGFVFANARPIGPIPMRGKLGLFNVPLSAINEHGDLRSAQELEANA